MKFRIKGDVVKIKKFLDIFIKEAEKEYKEQMKGSKVAKAQKMSPIPISFPDEIMMGYYVEKDNVILGIPSMPIPIGFLQRKAEKKMRKNLEKFFKSNGVKVDIDVMKDEE